MNHTPTPWHVSTKYNDTLLAVVQVHGNPQNQVVARTLGNSPDTAHIVRCVNAHDYLVEALTKISNTPCDHGGQDECPREIARAALAKAKGAQHD
tara:strand:+ start:91 stop:375 length:285 start_codon:yes stop_codon:yes gene_type:complete